MTTSFLTSPSIASPLADSADPYARIADLDDASIAALADRLELRASDARQHALWDAFLARVPDPAGRVLDVGCGTGTITQKIALLPAVDDVVGVDPCPGFVERARRRAPQLRFEVADGRALPFPDHSFDGLVLVTTLCHVPDPGRALVEAHRVLRPGGFLLVYEGDYAAATVALTRQDPLQACVDAAVAALVHDPWLARRLAPLVRRAGFTTDALVAHGYLDADSPTYSPSLVDAGADRLALAGTITASTAAALKDEARARAATGRYFGHIAYVSLLARRP
jgi:ubiquinone/menaquinone biosynthesis C-methylase UbiE